MKKILLLTLISGLAVGANAQWHDNRGPNRDAPYANGHFDRRDDYSSIDRINRQFDERIEAVKCDQFLSRRQRRQQVRELEQQRRHAMADYRVTRNRHDGGYGYSHGNDHDRDRW